MDLLEHRFHINPTGDGGPVDHVQEVGEFLGDGRKIFVLECKGGAFLFPRKFLLKFCRLALKNRPRSEITLF